MTIGTAEAIRLTLLLLTFIAVLTLTVSTLRRKNRDRMMLIDELKKNADDLAEQTKRIAEELHRETIRKAAEQAEELKARIDQVTARFDEVGRDVKSVVVDTHRIVDKHLEGNGVTPTMNEATDTIRAHVEETERVVKETNKTLATLQDGRDGVDD